MQRKSPRRLPLLLCLLTSSATLSSGCALLGGGGTVAAEPNCPRPSVAEANDYNSLAPPEGELPRPLMQWGGRLINYCWPAAAEAARVQAEQQATEDEEANAEAEAE